MARSLTWPSKSTLFLCFELPWSLIATESHPVKNRRPKINRVQNLRGGGIGLATSSLEGMVHVETVDLKEREVGETRYHLTHRYHMRKSTWIIGIYSYLILPLNPEGLLDSRFGRPSGAVRLPGAFEH